MKYGKRVAAFALSLVVALGAVCYRPPKAEAVVLESAALASAAVSVYLSATGFSFAPGANNWDADGANAAIGHLITDFDAAIAEAEQQLLSEIRTCVQIASDGVVKITAAGCALLNDFSNWLIEKFGLIGEDGVPVADAVQVYSGVTRAQMADGSFVSVYDGDTPPETMPVDAFIDNGKYYLYDGSYVELYGQYQYFYDSTGVQLMSANGSIGGVALGVYTSLFGPYPCLLWYDVDGQFLNKTTLNYGTTSISALYGPDAVVSLSVSLSPDYEAAPDVDEQYAMVVDTGLTFEDEQSYIDAVLNGVAAGTLSPTYTIEETTAGDVTVPGEDAEDDTQVGLLGRIANGIESLADTMLNGLASLFAPDPALMTEITGTFSAKFDFISVLHGLGMDLLNLNPDQSPPVIYIHLEDAEGSIVYGGTEKALDMAWYARYKEDVDRIMSGFLWLGFLWLVFKRASAIIQGAEMAGDYQADIDQGYRFRGERNGKRF